MFINAGARSLLLQGERQKFLAEEWPRISANIQRLGLETEQLLKASVDKTSASTEARGNEKAPQEENKP
jgi:GntR family transcriptional regulator